MKETREKATEWAEARGFTFPVLHDAEGEASTRYAPEGVQPDLERADVPIAANLIIDPEGKIRFYTLLDSANFDAKLVALKAKLEELMGDE